MSIDDRESHDSKLTSFNLILLLTITVHQVEDERLHLAWLILACAIVGLNGRYRRGATTVVFGVLLVRYGFDFPSVANHSYLELLLLSLYLWIDSSRTEEKELFLQACRWLTVLIFFYSGVQKLWYGEYFDGRYLVYLAGMADRSRTAFEFFIPPEEMARLISYKRVAGSGPFLIDSASGPAVVGPSPAGPGSGGLAGSASPLRAFASSASPATLPAFPSAASPVTGTKNPQAMKK